MKRFISMLLCALFILSTLSACGGQQGATRFTEEGNDEKTDTGRVNEDGTPFGKYEEPLKIKMIKYLDSTVAGYLSILEKTTGETLEDNRWTRDYLDKLNLEFEYMMTGSGSAYDNSFAGMMASGELPDIFHVGLSDYKDLVEADMIWDLTDLYDQYVGEATQMVLDEAGESVFDAITIDGRLYGVPLARSQYDPYKYLWIRRDWMEAVGVTEAPSTVYELIDLMGKFVEQKPGGQENTYAFALSKDLWFNLEGFFWCFGAYPDSWIVDEDGNVKRGIIDDNMREPLRILQKMYKDGWIDPEYITTSFGGTKTLVANEQVGIYIGTHYNATDVLLTSYNKNNDVDWAVFPWPGQTEGSEAVAELELGMDGPLVVNKNFKNPEAVFKMLNLYYENLYGETGDYEEWGNDETDQIWAIGPLFSYRALVNAIPYRDIRDVLNGTKTEAELSGLGKDYYDSAVLQNRYDWRIMFGDASSTTVTGGQCAGYFLDRVTTGEIKSFTDVFVAAPTDSMNVYGSELATQVDIFINSVIQGEKNVDGDFDAFIEAWLNGGGRQMTEEADAWYKSVKD